MSGELIRKVASWYAVRSWWVDLDDLVQEGWVAVLEAQRTCDPTRDRDRYLYQAVSYKLKEYIWSQSAPVTGRRGYGRQTLQGLRRVSLDTLHSAISADPTAIEAAERWWLELSQAVHQIVRNSTRGHVAARVLLDCEKAVVVAADEGLSINQVWRASSNARRRVGADLDLYHAMRQGA